MSNLKHLVLLLLLLVSVESMAQTSKSKHRSSKAKKTAKAKDTSVAKATTATDSIAPLAPPAPPPPKPTIMQYLVSSYPEFSVLVKAINAVELNSTFETAGPVTVFAPVNRTFDNLPAGAISDILQPQMRDSLKGVLTYIIVAGRWTPADLTQKIKEGGGSYSLPTIGGTGNLNFLLDGTVVRVKDNRGNQVQLAPPTVTGNGLVYVIDHLLLPGGSEGVLTK